MAHSALSTQTDSRRPRDAPPASSLTAYSGPAGSAYLVAVCAPSRQKSRGVLRAARPATGIANAYPLHQALVHATADGRACVCVLGYVDGLQMWRGVRTGCDCGSGRTHPRR